MPYKSPKLSPAEQTMLTKAQTDITAMLADFDRGEKCGIDCGPLREGAQQLLEISQQLQANFGQQRE